MSVDPIKILPENLGVAFFTIGWVVENVYKTEYTKIG